MFGKNWIKTYTNQLDCFKIEVKLSSGVRGENIRYFVSNFVQICPDDRNFVRYSMSEIQFSEM